MHPNKGVDFRPGVKRFSVHDKGPPKKRSRQSTHSPDTQPRTRHVKGACRKTYYDYCSESTIHGISYLQLGRHLCEKIFWFFLVLLSLIICASQIRTQYERWQMNPVIISFNEEPTPISDIPFPAVTICSETKSLKSEKINFTRFYYDIRNQGDRTIEKPYWLSEDDYLKMRALLHVCGNYLVQDVKFPHYEPLDIAYYLDQIKPPFSYNFVYCVFNQESSDCLPIFEKLFTKEGICYSFNSLNDSEIYRDNTYQYKLFNELKHLRKRTKVLDWDIAAGYLDPDNYKTYPSRVIGCGPRGGLLVVLEELEANLDYVCRGPVKGFKMVLHSPLDVPQVDKHFVHIPYDTDILVLVKPHLVYTTDEIARYDPAGRNCYYPSERQLRFFQVYTQNNCEIECLANFTLRTCGCVHFAMPRLENTKVCDDSKINCFDKAEDNYLYTEYTEKKKGKSCNCLPGCYTLEYYYEISQGDFNVKSLIQFASVDEYEEIKEAKISRIRIQYKFNEFTAWKRAELYGAADFLANCGGLFGLFMGISALSVIELLYHFTVRFYRNMQELKRAENNQ